MPLGSGYSAEEQVTGEAQHGGLQIVAYPLKPDVFEAWKTRQSGSFGRLPMVESAALAYGPPPDMALALGGRMRQEIYDDPFRLSDWDQDHPARCFVHIANSQAWRAITGDEPPTTPLTAKEYRLHGIPWFDYYGEGKAVSGSGILNRLKSLTQVVAAKGDAPPLDDEAIEIDRVVVLRKGLRKGQVREGRF
jgi:hypothetical protein